MAQKTRKESLKETVLKITSEQKPGTVSQLAQQVHEQFPSFSEREIFEAVVELQNEGKLHLTHGQPSATSLRTYLRTDHATWYWLTLSLTLAAATSVFAIPENTFPLVTIRYALGATFILWFPGYAFIKALFPVELPTRSTQRNLETIERVALSLGTSLALVPIVGLLLNYTPWGIRLTPIVLSLTAMTLAFATSGIIREYQKTKA